MFMKGPVSSLQIKDVLSYLKQEKKNTMALVVIKYNHDGSAEFMCTNNLLVDAASDLMVQIAKEYPGAANTEAI